MERRTLSVWNKRANPLGFALFACFGPLGKSAPVCRLNIPATFQTASLHNCHGLGQRQCINDVYRTGGDLKMGNERTIFELNKAKEK
ncbi:hypothetical protein NEICINOT_04490 [Neisseria cinerea ATCC 14685]|uniref:Uncharacterized protein n=1 Tax=Neisseria cinerea ATCC 14685 TaxID=546262 RepID=D0W494_NEICI|nr:hypothetical protein NEICINOT_04490 [Neisseria cinerea ATCC 14685]